MLERAIEFAVGAILDEQTRESQDAKDETLGERRKVVDLDLGEFIVAADIFENGVEAIENAGPIVKIASWPTPFGNAIEDTR